MRRLFASFGELFGHTGFEFFIGLVGMLLSLPKASQLIPIGNIADMARLALSSLIVGVLFAVACRILSVWFYWFSEVIPAGIKIDKPPIRDDDKQFDLGNKKAIILSNFASLRVTNTEHSELTECYALLKKCTRATINLPISFLGAGQNLLTWKGSDVDSGCKTTIGAHGGEAILRVYQVVVRTDDKAMSVERSEFCVCDGHKNAKHFLPVGVYDVEIEIHGKLGGKEVRSRSYTGFVAVRIATAADSVEVDLRIDKGKPPNGQRQARGRFA